MRIQSKTFYADLFSKTPAAAEVKPRPETPPKMTAVKPMAALPTALVSTPQEAPGQAPSEAAAEAAPGKTLALPVPVPVQAPAAAVDPKRSALRELIGELDIHHMSPRQMTHLSQTLYAAGALSFEDYSQLAFQPELHPDFERTIGALTGEHAAPDQRRDFVSLWNERADFQRRHNAARPDLIEQSERIAAVLSRIETPMNVVA